MRLENGSGLDVYNDHDDILDFINALPELERSICFESLAKAGDDECSITYLKPDPVSKLPVHVLLFKFTKTDDDGLLLVLAKSRDYVNQYFVLLKEQCDSDENFILIGNMEHMVNELFKKS